MLSTSYCLLSTNLLAAHTGLEPVISALRGQRVNQLHHCAVKRDYRERQDDLQVADPRVSPVTSRSFDCMLYSAFEFRASAIVVSSSPNRQAERLGYGARLRALLTGGFPPKAKSTSRSSMTPDRATRAWRRSP